MRIRNVLEEYEAMLEPLPASPYQSARGKAEWKTYGDGTRQCKVKASGLKLPDGATLELFVDDRRIAKVTVLNGMAQFRRETERGEVVPSVKPDQILQVQYVGQVVLAGQFYEE
jgi:hypothetical protein